MRLEVGRTQPWRNYCKLSCKLIELAYIGESRLKCLSCVLFAYFFISVDTFLVKEVISIRIFDFSLELKWADGDVRDFLDELVLKKSL